MKLPLVCNPPSSSDMQGYSRSIIVFIGGIVPRPLLFPLTFVWTPSRPSDMRGRFTVDGAETAPPPAADCFDGDSTICNTQLSIFLGYLAFQCSRITLNLGWPFVSLFDSLTSTLGLLCLLFFSSSFISFLHLSTPVVASSTSILSWIAYSSVLTTVKLSRLDMLSRFVWQAREYCDWGDPDHSFYIDYFKNNLNT